MSDSAHQKYFQWTVYRPRTNWISSFLFNKTHRPNTINSLWTPILAMSVPSVFWERQFAYWTVGMRHSQEMGCFSEQASTHRIAQLLKPHNTKAARPGHNHKGQRPPWRSRVVHWLLLTHPTKKEEKPVSSQTTTERANIYQCLCQYSPKTLTQELLERGISPPVFLSYLKNSNHCIF